MNKDPRKTMFDSFVSTVKNYPGKKLCKKCGNNYHPDNFDMCWNCYSMQPARITGFKGNEEGYASVKDWSESTI